MENNNTNKDANALNSILGFLLLPIVTFLFLLNISFPAMLTWNLFIPQFFGLPVLTVPTALMIILTLSILTGTRTQRTDDIRSDSTKTNDLIVALLSPWVVYVLAFINYKLFIQ